MRAAIFAPLGAVETTRRSANGMWRTRMTIAAVAALFMLGKPGVATAISLEEAVQLAVRTHPTVLAAKEARRSAAARIREARAGFRPSFDVRVAGGFADTNNSSTRARLGRTPSSSQGDQFARGESSMLFVQPLFDGFDSRNRTEAATARFDAAGSRVVDSSESTGLRAVTAYLSVIRGQELVELAETNVERHTDIVDRIRIQVEGGGGSAADLDQASGRLALATSTLLQLRGNLRQSEAAYLEVVGQPVDTLDFPFDSDLPIPDQVDEALAEAVGNNPTLAAAAQETRARAKDLQASRSPFYPRVTFEVEGTRNQNIGGIAGPSNEAKAMVVLNLNIFQGGAKSARVDAARARLSEARLRESEARRGVEQNVRNSYAAFATSRERTPVLESHVDSSERALEAYAQQFILGRRTLLDVLNVENEAFGAKASLLSEQITELLSQYRILTALGRLLETLGVAAAAPTVSQPAASADKSGLESAATVIAEARAAAVSAEADEKPGPGALALSAASQDPSADDQNAQVAALPKQESKPGAEAPVNLLKQGAEPASEDPVALPRQEAAPASEETGAPGESAARTPEQTVSQPAARAAGQSYQVQLAAYRKPAGAEAAWTVLSSAYPDLLADLSKTVRRADLGATRGVVHQLRVGPFAGEAKATALCETLKKRGADCFVVAQRRSRRP